MIFTEDIETMQFGLIEGKEYNIFKGNKKHQNAIYIGESGVKNDYLMFKSINHNIIECYLKIDIAIGEYKIIEVGRNIKKNKKVI